MGECTVRLVPSIQACGITRQEMLGVAQLLATCDFCPQSCRRSLPSELLEVLFSLTRRSQSLQERPLVGAVYNQVVIASYLQSAIPGARALLKLYSIGGSYPKCPSSNHLDLEGSVDLGVQPCVASTPFRTPISFAPFRGVCAHKRLSCMAVRALVFTTSDERQAF